MKGKEREHKRANDIRKLNMVPNETQIPVSEMSVCVYAFLYHRHPSRILLIYVFYNILEKFFQKVGLYFLF